MHAGGGGFKSCLVHHLIRSVAQSGSATALGAVGREFESLHSDQRIHMLKELEVLDNFLPKDEAVNLRKYTLSLPYFTNEPVPLPGLNYSDEISKKPKGWWRGHRSIGLKSYNPNLHKQMVSRVLDSVFSLKTVFEASTYSTISPGSMNEIPESFLWHVDDNESILSAVLYLNKEPSTDTGTFIKIDNKIEKVENKFNRLVIYRANILHRPGNCFGNTAEDSRHVITFFVRTIGLRLHDGH